MENNHDKTLPEGFRWVRMSSFSGQIKEVWELRHNDVMKAYISVSTISFCTIHILGKTHKSIHGIKEAKIYVEQFLEF